MASRYEVSLMLTSAYDLNSVVAWIDPDGPKSKLSGPVAANTNDEDGATCQQWSHTIKVPLNCPIADAVLRVNIFQVNASLMDCAHLPIRDLVSVDGMGGATTIRLQLHHPSSADTVPTVKVKVFVRDTYAPRPDTGGISYALPYPEPILLEPTYPEPILLEPSFSEPILREPSFSEPILREPSYPGRGFGGSRRAGRR